MEKFVLDYLSKIEGFKTRIKEIHWEEGTISGHELAGDVEKDLCAFEDSLAEDLQGVFDVDIKTSELEPVKSSANSHKELINEIYDATVEFYHQLDGDKFIGARSEVEGYIHSLNVKKYLVKKTIKESKQNKNMQISETKLIKMIAESVMDELSSDLLSRAADSASKHKDANEFGKDEHGNELDRHGKDWSSRIRKFRNGAYDAAKRETNEGELEQEALRIWNENNLENEVEWEESDWATSGDETYGPCSGFVECDGWEFIVPGEQDGEETNIDYGEGIEFTSPDNENGMFYLA